MGKTAPNSKSSAARTLYGLSAAAFCLVHQSSAAAQETPLLFDLIEEKVADGEIQVFNGAVVVSSDWNSIVVARLPPGSDILSCSAVLVGARVLLTAAHCVDTGTRDARPIRIRVGTDQLEFKCRMDRAYTDRIRVPGWEPPDADYALCALPQGLSTPARFRNLRREWIDLSPPGAEDVVLTGYGCTTMTVNLAIPSLEFGPFDEKTFSVGKERLQFLNLGGTKLTTVSDDAKEPALCRSDSGGPLFTGATIGEASEGRSVRGVNSWVSVDTSKLVSSYASLSATSFLNFLGCWMRDHPYAAIQLRNPERVPPCAD